MRPLTLEEHREWERTATRPYTQQAIGASTHERRTRDAHLSRLVTDIQTRQPVTPRKEIAGR